MGPGHGLRGSANTPPLTRPTVLSRAGIGKKEDLAPSKDLLYLRHFPLSPICNPCSPWSIKRRAGPPTKGMNSQWISSTHTTHHAYSQAATELLASFRPFHQRLGTFPSLDCLYSLLRTFFGTNNTSSSKLDVGTFNPNQYKPRVL